VAVLGTVLIALSGVPGDGLAEETPVPEYSAEQAAPEPEHIAPPLLDQMLAPIALYPDALLSQILMASTYPLEVVEAHRWVSEPGNAALTGPALEAALETREWDPSVKSLVPFPDILKIMNDKLGWMQDLGNAFLSQQQDVMDAVQRLRNQAAAAGNLQSNEQQRVVTEQRTIIIQQASPQVVYVPVYDPFVVYGPWHWSAYPPMYFDPFPRYGIRIGAFSWFSFGIVNLYWGWNSFDWHHHHIRIDRHRYDRIWRHRDPYPRDHWEHDPRHRRGVAYVDQHLRSRYRPNPSGLPASRADYRGYPTTIARAEPPVRPNTAVDRTPSTGQPKRPLAPDKPERDDTAGGQRPQPAQPKPPRAPDKPARDDTNAGQRPQPAQPKSAVAPDRPVRPARPDDRTRPANSAPDRDTRPSRETEPRRPDRPVETTRRRVETDRETSVPPAFEGYSNGEAVRAATARARDSRQSEPAPAERNQESRPDRPGREESRNQQRRER